MEHIRITCNRMQMIVKMAELSSILSGIVRFSNLTHKDHSTG